MFDHVRTFYQPSSVSEAIRLLRQRDGEACVVAGGTDLVLTAGHSVTALVDISRLDLSYIKQDARGTRIGATTTMAALIQSSVIRRLGNGILANAAAVIGGRQIRNLATLGGNLVSASPAADTATPLLALDAQVVLQGLRGKRRAPLGGFFSGPHQSAANGSLVIEIVIPPVPPRSGWSFQRLSRTETDIAIVNVAAVVQLSKQNRCALARIALGAVAPQPMRALKAESVLTGQSLAHELIENAAGVAADEVLPITDVRASAEYRREMCRVLVRRALTECANRLECAL